MPIITSKHKAAHDTSSLWAWMRAVPKTLNCTEHPITLAFAVTDFKLQGKTLEKLVLSIAPRPFPPHLDLKAFYVMVSRVRARCGLRLLHRPPQRTGGLKYLLKLHHAPALAAWNSHYDAAGDWDPLRDPEPSVSAAAPKRRRKRPRAAAGTDAE